MSHTNNTQPVNTPIHRERVGNVVVAIWETMGQYGPMHGFTVVKRYRRQPQPGDTQVPGNDGMVWASTASLNADDLLAAPLAIQRARNWSDARKASWAEQVRATQQATAPAQPPARPQQPAQPVHTLTLPNGRVVTTEDQDLAAAYEMLYERAMGPQYASEEATENGARHAYASRNGNGHRVPAAA